MNVIALHILFCCCSFSLFLTVPIGGNYLRMYLTHLHQNFRIGRLQIIVIVIFIVKIIVIRFAIIQWTLLW